MSLHYITLHCIALHCITLHTLHTYITYIPSYLPTDRQTDRPTYIHLYIRTCILHICMYWCLNFGKVLLEYIDERFGTSIATSEMHSQDGFPKVEPSRNITTTAQHTSPIYLEPLAEMGMGIYFPSETDQKLGQFFRDPSAPWRAKRYGSWSNRLRSASSSLGFPLGQPRWSMAILREGSWEWSFKATFDKVWFADVCFFIILTVLVYHHGFLCMVARGYQFGVSPTYFLLGTRTASSIWSGCFHQSSEGARDLGSDMCHHFTFRHPTLIRTVCQSVVACLNSNQK